MVKIQRNPLGRFGLAYRGNKITFLTVGGPADLAGKIEIGDEIMYINGIYVKEDAETREITSLIGKSGNSATIVFQRGSIV